MKICVICPEMGNSAGNAFIGGHVNAVLQLSKALFDRGHGITIITTPHRYPGNKPDNDIFNGWAEVYTLPISSSYPTIKYGFEYAIESIRKVKELHKIKTFDIIHGHSGYSMLALITGISAKTTGLPSVHSIYCPIHVTSGNAVKLLSNNIFSKFYFSGVSKIIGVTRNVAQSLMEVGIAADTIAEIPIGINTELYNPYVSGDYVRKMYSINPDQPTIIYVGNLTTQKGLLILIEALNIVVKKIPNVKLFMILNMPLERFQNPDIVDIDMKQLFKIKEKIKHYDLENNIVPLGLLDDMPQFLAASNFSITPFLDTVGIVDYPTSMIEAMAVGKPIIASRVGGIPEIIEHNKNGILIEPNNIENLANSILELINHQYKTKNMGEQAAKTISRRYGCATIAARLEKLYEEVISDYNSNRRY